VLQIYIIDVVCWRGLHLRYDLLLLRQFGAIMGQLRQNVLQSDEKIAVDLGESAEFRWRLKSQRLSDSDHEVGLDEYHALVVA